MRLFGVILNAITAFGYLSFVAFLAHDSLQKPSRHFPWLTVALGSIFLTCGAHHVEHVIHIVNDGRVPGTAETFVTGVQALFSMCWLFLRFEALGGGAGDRRVRAFPPGIVLPAWAIYTMLSLTAATGTWAGTENWSVAVSVMLFLLYGTIAWKFSSQQMGKRTWSLSGICISAFFYNCGLGHALFGFYLAQGMYPDYDWHGRLIDTVALIPPVLYLALGMGSSSRCRE